jgi:hypothetical protein
MIDPRLKEYATPRQLEFIEAVEQHGSTRKAAKALGINARNLDRGLALVKAKAASMGYSPDHAMTRPVPDGFKVKGVSTYYDEDGKARGQWVKSTADQERQRELMQAAFEAMADELPRQTPIPAPEMTHAQLANLYTFTDSHVGMLAWHKENLDRDGDWDLSIAERVLTGCFDYMVQAAPMAKVGIVAQLGDFLHSDGMKAITPTSGHLLDQDGRFPKVVQTAIRILRKIVNFALTKHEIVVVLLAEGNHDLASSIWLRSMFQALYENEPRVQVIDSELPYYVYQHGETMLAWHHGHLSRKESLPLLFAAQFPKVWGNTERRYIHTGHYHHVDEKEHPGVHVIQHPTLAARDAYASRGGWISERQCRVITYHESLGEVARNTVRPEMVAA